MKLPINRYKVSEKGLKQVLGELEVEIMEIVWRRRRASVRDVLLDLEKDRDIAYTTVMTVMARLNKKRVLERYKEGQAFIYSPAITKEELREGTVKEVLKSLISNSSDMAMVHFVDEIAKDPESLKQLQELISRRLGE